MNRLFVCFLACVSTMLALAQNELPVDANMAAEAFDDCDDDDDCGCGEGEDYQNTYVEMAERIDGSFDVEGGIGIEQFVKAMPVLDEDFWQYCDYTMDKPNGFFYFGEEGDGSVSYYASYWNRNDGKKLFIFSYCVSEWIMYDKNSDLLFGTTESVSPWYRYQVIGDMDKNESLLGIDAGCRAYLYNPSSKQLEPLQDPPFNNMPESEALRVLELPRKGKDITIHEMMYDAKDYNDPKTATHTLKWNGMTFDYVK